VLEKHDIVNVREVYFDVEISADIITVFRRIVSKLWNLWKEGSKKISGRHQSQGIDIEVTGGSANLTVR